MEEITRCVFCDQICNYQISSPPNNKKQNTSVYNDIVICLKCPTLQANITVGTTSSKFLNALKNQFLSFQQKIDLDQMLLNKQKFSIQRTQGNIKEHSMHESALKAIIDKYATTLSRGENYLKTLQMLSDIIGRISGPDKIWEMASSLMINKIDDLDAIGLLLLEKGKGYYTETLPQKLTQFIEECIGKEVYLSRLMDTQTCSSLCQIYWENQKCPKRLSPRTEYMLERCLFFPIKGPSALTGIFICLMKRLYSPTDESIPFFFTAARLISKGVIEAA